ncbi:helix-turn-helix domain-containing protein [Streptomyces sp. NBC_01808]|nr:helix-turn-helix domain-containing protein [Streptomyces sp. NBC_01808]WSA37446.1 helix-turn-helix domain-containing protein [Streptomyces sp. NBC_01808]
MSRYRMRPTAGQERVLASHCANARFVWNLAVEQHSWWTPRRGSAPGYVRLAGQWTGRRARAKPSSVAAPAGIRATPM